MAVLGRTTLEVPRLGLGAMTWGEPKGFARFTPAKIAYGGADGATAEAAAFEASVDAGVTLFDTAAVYSNGVAESRLGELARGRDVLIGSKCPMGFSTLRPDDFPAQLRGSLDRLGRATIDLYQHHFPGRTDIDALMMRMADAVEAGTIRAVGVSNYSAAQMRLAHAALARRGVPLASNQVEYSLLKRTPEVNGVMEACRDLGVTLIAYSPLASGMLSGKYSSGETAHGVRRFMPRFWRGGREAARPVVDLLRTIGEGHGRTPAQVALRWLIENPIVLPIPGAKNAEQAIQNAGALGFSLNPEEVDALDRATTAWRR
jgi:aryl-alcohol dehydrogenase-like predicted oxidoreductase